MVQLVAVGQEALHEKRHAERRHQQATTLGSRPEPMPESWPNGRLKPPT